MQTVLTHTKQTIYFSTITHYARTVEDAIALSRQFDFGTSMELQIHIADSTGDAVIISPDRTEIGLYPNKSRTGFSTLQQFQPCDSRKWEARFGGTTQPIPC